MIKEIARQVALRGGRAFFVGGYVRDLLLGKAAGPDIDIEIFDMLREDFVGVLEQFGPVKHVGASFKVYKVKGLPEFDFVLSEANDYTSACLRRDFTINAILKDVLSSELIDPLQGQDDLKSKTIRLSAPQNFHHDPLRAYRAAVLAARLDFSIEPVTSKFMKQCDLSRISKERIFSELNKLLLLSERPSKGFIYLEQSGILAQVHPRLQDLVNCPQPLDHHPEGDAWQHTLMVLDRAAQMKGHSQDPRAFMMAALLHDIGKPLMTEIREGRITSYGHDTAGEDLALDFLREFKCSGHRAARIASLVREHMRPVLLFKTRDQVGDRAIRKLAKRVDTRELLLLSEADYLGRSTDRDFRPIKQWFLDRLNRVGLEPGDGILPVIRGQDLIDIGYAPGPHFSSILEYAFSLQLDGLNRLQILGQIDERFGDVFGNRSIPRRI